MLPQLPHWGSDLGIKPAPVTGLSRSARPGRWSARRTAGSSRIALTMLAEGRPWTPA